MGRRRTQHDGHENLRQPPGRARARPTATPRPPNGGGDPGGPAPLRRAQRLPPGEETNPPHGNKRPRSHGAPPHAARRARKPPPATRQSTGSPYGNAPPAERGRRPRRPRAVAASTTTTARRGNEPAARRQTPGQPWGAVAARQHGGHEDLRQPPGSTRARPTAMPRPPNGGGPGGPAPLRRARRLPPGGPARARARPTETTPGGPGGTPLRRRRTAAAGRPARARATPPNGGGGPGAPSSPHGSAVGTRSGRGACGCPVTPARPATAGGYRLPRRACSRSIASNRALKLPLPKPIEPWRSMISKKTVGRSWTGLVKICSR
ncbi:hypothetical protein QFZ55_003152 [Streptomyces luteogriseus]|nr:hypothetical protein [Streptomyces luteogriseus]